jgi:hypothetical protein
MLKDQARTDVPSELRRDLDRLPAVPAAVMAEEAGRTWRIGYLSLVSARLEQSRRWIAAFQEGLRKLGYVESQNAIIEQRYAAGQIERLPALAAAELIELKVDVVVAAPAGSALAAKKVTSTVPIVFMDGLPCRRARSPAARRHLRRQNPEGGQACRSRSSAAGAVQAHHQPEDRQDLGLTIPPSFLVRADQVVQ